MGDNLKTNTALLSYVLAGVVAVSSLGGLLLPEVYAKETPSWAAQGMGQDFVDLVLVAPLLALFTRLAQKGKRIFLFLIGGILVYLVYSYLIYAFYIHFNRLFFLYCAGLGLSVYALVLMAIQLQKAQVETWFSPVRSTALPALYFLATTLVFYFLWLSEDVPALISGIAPKSLAETGLPTNPIHVLDLSIVLPAMALASLQLLWKKPLGYLLFPIMLAFAIVMVAAIGGMMVEMKLKGITSDLTVAYVFGVGVMLNSIVLGLFFKNLKRT
jgi:hypothetical protein